MAKNLGNRVIVRDWVNILKKWSKNLLDLVIVRIGSTYLKSGQ